MPLRSSASSHARTSAAGVLLVTGALHLALASLPAFAQQEVAQADAPERRAQEEIDRTKASPAPVDPGAGPSILDEAGGPVNFADVFKAPDDIELNVRFARQQIRQGNLLGASNTIERVLVSRPDAHRVRLLYAIVLFRLRSIDAAAREFERLEKAPLSASDRAEVSRYSAAIDDLQQRTRMTVGLTLGAQFDSNRNASPELRALEAKGLSLREGSGKIGDQGFLAVGAIGVVHDLGYQAGHRVFANVSAFNQMNAENQHLDLLVSTADIGGMYRLPYLDLIPRLFVNYANLDQRSFNQTYGAELGIRNDKIFDGFGAGLVLRGQYENYNKNMLKTGPNVRNDLRDGMFWEAEADVFWRALPFLQIGLSQGFAYKDANNGTYVASGREKRFHERRFEYTTGFDVSALVWRGIIAAYGLDYTVADYVDPDPFVNAGRERFDRSLRHTLTLSMPVTAIPGAGELLPPLARSLRLIGIVEHTDQDSSIRNYRYENTAGKILFSNQMKF